MNAGGLTADLIAVALVAAARQAGIDPLQVFDAAPHGAARVRRLAAAALSRHGDSSGRSASRALSVPYTSCAPAQLRSMKITDQQIAGVVAVLARRAAALAPPPIRDVVRPAPSTAISLDDRLLAMLDEGAHTTVALATRLGAKELVVGQMLSMLRHHGRVAADPLGDGGLRGQLWRRVGA